MSSAKRTKRSASAEPRRSPPMHEDESAPQLEAVDLALLDEEEGEDVSTATPKKPGFSGGFDALKSFNGQVYSGMAIGGSHKWNYDSGVWTETKEEPDLWKINYETHKRRSHNAPTGSGAPVGTEYHWFIVAHQYVKKLDANTYSTRLSGHKYKLCHKGADAANWSIPKVKAQRDREIFLLDDAKKRVEGLPPVLASEKVKVSTVTKGQKTLDAMFGSSPVKKTKEEASPSKSAVAGEKRER